MIAESSEIQQVCSQPRHQQYSIYEAAPSPRLPSTPCLGHAGHTPPFHPHHGHLGGSVSGNSTAAKNLPTGPASCGTDRYTSSRHGHHAPRAYAAICHPPPSVVFLSPALSHDSCEPASRRLSSSVVSFPARGVNSGCVTSPLQTHGAIGTAVARPATRFNSAAPQPRFPFSSTPSHMTCRMAISHNNGSP